VREGEEPGVAHAPFVQLCADGFDELFRDALPLTVGAHRNRPEEADASPTRCEIRADQLAVEFRGEAGDMLAPEAAIDIIAVAPETLRLRSTQKCPEGGAAYASCGRQVAFG